MKSTFTEVFGSSLPIIQAPMAGFQGSELAIAVANAGGVGSLACATLGPDEIKRELKAVSDNSNKNFNINFFCHDKVDENKEVLVGWQKSLNPYYKEFNCVFKKTNESKGKRKSFDFTTAKLIESIAPKIMSFHFGLPDNSLISFVKGWGTKILSSATTLEEAIWLEKNGVDVIIAQGLEAGGHRGHFLLEPLDLSNQQNTVNLVQAIVKKVKVPVIAAGGLSNKNDISEVMNIGACGVQLGTTYLLCPEAKTSKLQRQALKDKTRKTTVTNLFSGRPARGIINRFIDEMGPINKSTPGFPNASAILQPIRESAEALSDSGFTPLWSGKNRQGCQEIPASDLTWKLFN